MNSLSATIIIPTCDRPEDLLICLRLLVPQLPPDGSVEVLVCDDGQNPATRAMITSDFPTVRWQAGPRRGPAANRNLGARNARGEWLIFIDDDCQPRPGFVQAHLEARTAGPVVLIGPTFRIGEKSSLLWEAPHNPEARDFISCNFGISRETIIAVGLFDERYPMALFEDTELAARMERMGMDFRAIPGAIVDHPLRPTPPSLKLAKRWEARVISTYDFGASTAQLAWRLPRHIAMVILSRFRGVRLTAQNLRAVPRFAAEFLLALCFLPGWIARHGSTPGSPFWKEQTRLGKAPPQFGL